MADGERLGASAPIDVGFGATKADMERGYCVPDISGDPKYEMVDRGQATLAGQPTDNIWPEGARDWDDMHRRRYSGGFLDRTVRGR